MFSFSGIIGVLLGAVLSTHFSKKYPRADALICGIGLVISAIFVLAALFLVRIQVIAAFFIMFVGCVALNLNWSIVADILLYTVLPNRRSTANALQILISHLFGDAGSPYIIGEIIDAIRSGITNPSEFCGDLANPEELISLAGKDVTRCEVYLDYYVMQYSLIANVFVELLGGIFFFITAIYIFQDKLRVNNKLAIHLEEPEQNPVEDANNETGKTSN